MRLHNNNDTNPDAAAMIGRMSARADWWRKANGHHIGHGADVESATAYAACLWPIESMQRAYGEAYAAQWLRMTEDPTEADE